MAVQWQMDLLTVSHECIITSCFHRFVFRLLLPYERHLKGEQDMPLPLTKPRKQESSQEKASAAGAKTKAVGVKKLKGPKPGSKKDKGETRLEQTQVSSNCCLIMTLSGPVFFSLCV